MKKSRILILLALMLALLLSGCARSDVTLKVNDDGSFNVSVQYGIDKSLMGSEEVKEQVKSLITDALKENEIPYTEGETEEFVTITVEREFKDLNELTTASKWQGISMAPKFSSVQAEGGLWARIEDGKFKLSGTLNSETFGAKDFVEQNSEVASGFGGSLTVLASSAISASGGEAVSDNEHKWSGSSSDSFEVELETEKLNLPEDYDEGIKDTSPSQEDQQQTTPEGIKGTKLPLTIQIVVVAAIIGVVAVIAAVIIRRKKNE